MSTVFSIDTTSHECSLSVCEDEKTVAEYNFSSGRALSSLLIPSVDFILKNLNMSLEDIDLFGICIGPGLFTGVRVGLSTLKGMLAGKEKPVVPVTSLEAWAFKLKNIRTNIIPLIDGRRGEVYMSGYYGLNEYGLLSETISPLITGVETISDFLPKGEKFTFNGSGALKYRERISETFKSSLIKSGRPFLSHEISRIALLKFQSGEYLINSDDLLPLYIRKPDAEKNFK